MQHWLITTPALAHNWLINAAPKVNTCLNTMTAEAFKIVADRICWLCLSASLGLAATLRVLLFLARRLSRSPTHTRSPFGGR